MSKRSDASPRGSKALVAVLVVGSYACFAVAVGLSVARIGTVDLKTVLDDVLFQSAFLGFPAVGGLLAIRRRRNPVGWLLLGLGAVAATSWLTKTLIEHQQVNGQVGAALGVAGSLTNALTPVTLLIFLAFLLYFPDAVLRGWQRVMLQVAAALTTIMVIVRLFRPGPLDLGSGAAALENPLATAAFAPIRDITDPLSSLVGVALLVAVGVVVARFVRADGIRRLQYKWLIAALAVAIALQFATQFLPEDDTAITIEDFASVVAIDIGLLGLCVAIAVAVTRHRLYDLDRIVSRTLAWSIVTAAVVAIYAGAVVALGGLLRALGGEANDLVVAASTLVAAVSVRPLLRRIRHVVDRRFDRARYDAVAAVEALSARLRQEVEVDSVVRDLTSTATQTLQPRTAWVLLLAQERP